jgi:hypothetical protein
MLWYGVLVFVLVLVCAGFFALLGWLLFAGAGAGTTCCLMQLHCAAAAAVDAWYTCCYMLLGPLHRCTVSTTCAGAGGMQ